MEYDYIICGGGASGLLLAYAMAQDPFFDDQQILIIEKNQKTTNDRTWCFWDTTENPLDSIVCKSWHQILFKDAEGNLELPIAPYTYKMIRSADFYSHVNTILANKKNIQTVTETITKIEEIDDNVHIQTANKTYLGAKAFNSIFNASELKSIQKPVLQQHFIGWFVKTPQAAFNAEIATFMDFSIPQEGNTRFMYVLPQNPNEALFEYTLFSEELLEKEIYENAIETYLESLGIREYEIIEKEQGSIPMTAHNFYGKNTQNLLHIGTAGGFTKASTGYTFRNTQVKTAEILHQLKKGNKDFSSYFSSNRFLWYDAILLEVLHHQNELGHKVFSTMFRKNKVSQILKFLDEDTTHLEEFRLINSLPKWPFVKAFFRNLFS